MLLKDSGSQTQKVTILVGCYGDGRLYSLRSAAGKRFDAPSDPGLQDPACTVAAN
jgi:hypothetical protein